MGDGGKRNQAGETPKTPKADHIGRQSAQPDGQTGGKSGDTPRRTGGNKSGAAGHSGNLAKPPRPASKLSSSKPATPRAKAPANSTPTDGAAAASVAAKDVRKWVRVQAQVRSMLGQDAYNSWFGRCRLEEVAKGQITLSVPTAFLKSWIKTHYLSDLLRLWQAEIDDILRVDVQIRSAVRARAVTHQSGASDSLSGGAQAQNNAASALDNGRIKGPHQQGFGHGLSHGSSSTGGAFGKGLGEGAGGKNGGMNHVSNGLPKQIVDRMSGRESSGGFVSGAGGHGTSGGQVPVSSNGRFGFSGSPLDPSYTFDTMVEGAANRVACAAAKSVAEADGAAAKFNPLFLHANVGLGKTHLLQSIAWAAASRNSGLKILYLTAEYFMWRFASAIRDQSALSFKESLREIDLLLIDDMQFLQGKSIQQEFCHLLNALIDSAKQVVVAADRPPSQLESLDKRVRSRLQGGVALEIASPDMAMREDILRLRYQSAQRDDPNLKIPPNVLKYVAETVTSSGRDLEGAFNQLVIQQRFTEGALDLDAIEKLLGHLVQSSEKRTVRIEDIQRVVARHYNVSRNDLLSSRRTRIIVRPRQVAMYLSKLLTPRSLPEIGRRFGGRDHTTVLHAVRKIEGLLAEDTQLAHEIELLKRLIHEQG